MCSDISDGRPCPDCGGTDYSFDENKEYVICDACGFNSADNEPYVSSSGDDEDFDEFADYWPS